MSIIIYHNPDCGTSRKRLEMIRQSGVEPTVIEYLKTPPNRAAIVKLVADAGLTIRGALRKKDAPFDALGLGDDPDRHKALSPFRGRAAHPRNPDIGPFTKEDGEVVISAGGKRLV